VRVLKVPWLIFQAIPASNLSWQFENKSGTGI